MKLKATIRAETVPATITVSYNGAGFDLVRDEQREQFSRLVTEIGKMLLEQKLPYARKPEFRQIKVN